MKNKLITIFNMTYEELLTDQKYRQMSRQELTRFINEEINFDVYEEIHGQSLESRVDYLINHYKNNPVMTEIQQLEKTLKDVQERLEALKSTKPKFEVGKWYYREWHNEKDIYLISEQDGYKIKTSQFFRSNSKEQWPLDGTTWSDNCANDSRLKLLPRLATPSEIEVALIAEAKRRNYKVGDKLSKLTSEGHNNITSMYSIIYYHGGYFPDSLQVGGAILYWKGQWAEIITEPKIEICGHTAEIKEGYVKIGCKEVHEIELRNISDLMTRCQFNQVTFDSNKAVSLEVIDKLLAKL